MYAKMLSFFCLPCVYIRKNSLSFFASLVYMHAKILSLFCPLVYIYAKMLSFFCLPCVKGGGTTWRRDWQLYVNNLNNPPTAYGRAPFTQRGRRINLFLTSILLRKREVSRLNSFSFCLPCVKGGVTTWRRDWYIQ